MFSSGYETDFGVSSTDVARVSTRRRERQLSFSIPEVRPNFPVKLGSVVEKRFCLIFVNRPLTSSGVDQFKQEFARLEEHNDDDEEERNSPPIQRKYTSLPR